MSLTLPRPGARALGALLVSGALVAAPSAPSTAPMVTGGDAGRYGVAAVDGPTTSSDPTLVGANYLEEELRRNDHHFAQVFDGVSYPDYGLTADAVLALAAAGTAQDEATLATAYLADHVVDYTGFGDPNEIAAGAVAKLLNVAVAQGVDPTSFGGFDLLATLQARENAQGRFVDQSAFGDYSNTFGQSLAVLGLERAGVGASPDASDYLALQQCPGGGFALTMTDAGCSDDSTADPDATSMAVQALVLVGGYGAETSAALDYLTGRQAADGGVGGGGPTAAVNANSTGLAGQAFLAGGRTAQARAATGFLTSLQFGCDLPTELRGGVAYDQARFDTATGAGADATTSDQDRRSTSQALLALAGVPLGAVTASGAAAQAPALACVEPEATPTPTGTSSTTPPTDAGAEPTAGAGGGADGGADDVSSGQLASAPAGALAQTGGDPLLPVALGLLLLVLGAVAVYGSRRRRGAHA